MCQVKSLVEQLQFQCHELLRLEEMDFLDLHLRVSLSLSVNHSGLLVEQMEVNRYPLCLELGRLHPPHPTTMREP